MKVKVGDKIYDGKEEPVMIIFSKEEKEQISNIHPGLHGGKEYMHIFCCYPDTEEWTKDDFSKIRHWMDFEEEQPKNDPDRIKRWTEKI